MGLLEDAIREHLELKRLRGADPTEVAREQHEALDPPPGQEPTAAVEDHSDAGVPQTDADGPALDGDAPTTADHPDHAPEALAAGDFSQTAQETAELDMEQLLANEPPADSDLAEGRETPPEAGEESLEWEVPARASRDPELHEGESGDAAARASGEDESARASDDDPEEGHSGAQPDASRQGRLSI
jgi:hypothetical protein